MSVYTGPVVQADLQRARGGIGTNPGGFGDVGSDHEGLKEAAVPRVSKKCADPRISKERADPRTS